MIETVGLIVLFFIISLGFVLRFFFNEELDDKVLAQIKLAVLEKGGTEVTVTADHIWRRRFIVTYQDEKGLLYTTMCRVKVVKGEPAFSWTLIAKSPSKPHLAAD